MQAGADRGVAQPVDEDEAAERRGSRHRARRRSARSSSSSHTPMSLSSSFSAASVLEGVDVDLVLERADGGRDGARADLHQVGAARQHRLLVHPHERRLELVGDLRRGIGGGQHVAAADVDLVGRASASPTARRRPPRRSPSAVDDARHRALRAPRAARARDRPGAPRPLAICPAKPRKSSVGPVHPLHRQAERGAAEGRVHLDAPRGARAAPAPGTRRCARCAPRCCRRAPPTAGWR